MIGMTLKALYLWAVSSIEGVEALTGGSTNKNGVSFSLGGVRPWL